MGSTQDELDLTYPGLPQLDEGLDFLRLIWAVDHALQRRSKSMTGALGITGPQRFVMRVKGARVTLGVFARALDCAGPAKRRERRQQDDTSGTGV